MRRFFITFGLATSSQRFAVDGFRFVQTHLSARWRLPVTKRRRTTRLTLGILKDFGTCDLVASPDRSASSLRISFGDKDKDKDSTRDFNRHSTDIQQTFNIKDIMEMNQVCALTERFVQKSLPVEVAGFSIHSST